jgi:hypothetical protein
MQQHESAESQQLLSALPQSLLHSAGRCNTAAVAVRYTLMTEASGVHETKKQNRKLGSSFATSRTGNATKPKRIGWLIRVVLLVFRKRTAAEWRRNDGLVSAINDGYRPLNENPFHSDE